MRRRTAIRCHEHPSCVAMLDVTDDPKQRMDAPSWAAEYERSLRADDLYLSAISHVGTKIQHEVTLGDSVDNYIKAIDSLMARVKELEERKPRFGWRVKPRQDDPTSGRW